MKKDKIKVVIWGFGAMGSGMAKMILNKKGFDIIGVCDVYKPIVGKSIFDLLNLNNSYNHNVFVYDSIDDILNNNKVDVVLLATDSYTTSAFPKIKKIVEYGVNVISTAEEMSYPKANQPELSEKLNLLAKKHNVTILGTGVNPGMMMDLLAICISGVVEDIKEFEISRINSLSPFGKTVMEEQGVGLTVKEFNEKLQKGEIAGHVGFKESAYMIADALGLEVKEFSQSMKPIITAVDRKSPHGFAKAGDVCGVEMSAEVSLKNDIKIKLYHPQQIEPEMAGVRTGDYIKILGKPEINLSNSPEVEGGIGTIAICVNMIPHVINAKPGLVTMIDLPVPRTIMGDVRNLIRED
ncbi:MAG: 2,4-diaminopentanoate dehydrogenase [Candidatus Izemoplasmatales bacterium]|nr:2,4-diaminopentanoate dehydrogenase [Candidatus Izemoplasmatales bacterium]